MEALDDFTIAISDVLKPYQSLIGSAAMVLTICQMLSPVFLFNDMRKAKSTMGIPFLPFMMMLLL